MTGLILYYFIDDQITYLCNIKELLDLLPISLFLLQLNSNILDDNQTLLHDLLAQKNDLYDVPHKEEANHLKEHIDLKELVEVAALQ
jgi:hypothetical protein